MSIPQYFVGSASADALSRLGNLQRLGAHYRTVDLVNIAGYCASEAHELLLTDPGTARDFLLNGASRMIRAAEQLESEIAGRKVVPLRVAS
ncbi:hypothetical protein [Sphingobium sp. WCS2017Hpa-17]|uniref:hypothetical protein n=1 Tax=Sphingobium sp. WCS2017Hpa-17 TaxID=3073638 RepID=UPI0028896B2F|nr:hypothetical protein [Sphingobium sp. WCS2017Hpa-17]